MSDARQHRQKILAGFLAILVILAIGAEITTPGQTSARADTGQVVSDTRQPASGTRKTSFKDQLAFLNSARVVASRFYASKHAPIIWTR